MVGTLVQGSRWLRVATGVVHVLASLIVAVTLGGLFALPLATVDASTKIRVLAAIAGLYLGGELGFWRVPLPQSGRQVPREWRYRFAPVVTAAFYGALLASGTGTRIPFPSYAVIFVSPLLISSPSAAISILGVYGMCRALTAVIVASASRRWPALGVGIGFQRRWMLKLAVIITTSLLLGALMKFAL
jgi:hypothetical protein